MVGGIRCLGCSQVLQKGACLVKDIVFCILCLVLRAKYRDIYWYWRYCISSSIVLPNMGLGDIDSIPYNAQNCLRDSAIDVLRADDTAGRPGHLCR